MPPRRQRPTSKRTSTSRLTSSSPPCASSSCYMHQRPRGRERRDEGTRLSCFVLPSFSFRLFSLPSKHRLTLFHTSTPSGSASLRLALLVSSRTSCWPNRRTHRNPVRLADPLARPWSFCTYLIRLTSNLASRWTRRRHLWAPCHDLCRSLHLLRRRALPGLHGRLPYHGLRPHSQRFRCWLPQYVRARVPERDLPRRESRSSRLHRVYGMPCFLRTFLPDFPYSLLTDNERRATSSAMRLAWCVATRPRSPSLRPS